MSLFLTLVVGGAGGAVAALAARWRAARRISRDGDRGPSKSEEAPSEKIETSRAPASSSSESDAKLHHLLKQNDVIVLADGSELWLASALLLSEASPRYTLFVAPAITGDRYLLADATGRARLVLLDHCELDPGTEPPSCVVAGETTFERIRRLPLGVTPYGELPLTLQAPSEITFAEYTSGRHVLLCLTGNTFAFAAMGEELVEGSYDHLPSEARVT